MSEALSRSERLLGREAMERLRAARVAVFGLGGVGGYVVEALARSGVGALDLVDKDTLEESNLNRQLLALHSTLGQLKTDAAAARVKDIAPDCVVRTWPVFYLPETRGQFNFTDYDYIIDAIDNVTGKISLTEQAKEAGVPIILAMGAGNKLDPTGFRVADLAKTRICPLAKVMRKELAKRGITHVKVVYSEEEPREPLAEEIPEEEKGLRRPAPGSVAFVPSVMGLILAGEVVKDLIRGDRPVPR